ncbi:MAG: transposase [Cryomorphaceae bacterium]
MHGYLDRFLALRDIEYQVLKLVRDVREDHPEMGLREMYSKIKPDRLGRDAFELLCKNAGLGVRIIKNGYKTTDSSGTRFFDNLLEGTVVNRPNQFWQSDITYYLINARFHYITLIQDTFTKRIVGHSASSSLATVCTTLPALIMAISCRKGTVLSGLIFHSDGGGQYYHKGFLALTQKSEIINSMGKSCYENAMAESLNGVIKNKYLRHRSINSLSDLSRELDRTVLLYNTDKPHSALQKMTPVSFEEKWLSFQSQTKAMMTESISAKDQMNGASNPIHLSQTKAQNPDVICAK